MTRAGVVVWVLCCGLSAQVADLSNTTIGGKPILASDKVAIVGNAIVTLPTPSIPAGGDVTLQVRGPADVVNHVIPELTTSATVVGAPGNQNITVGDTSKFYQLASIVIDRFHPQEETVPSGSWTVVDGVTLNVTFANTHAGTYSVDQWGAVFLKSWQTAQIGSDGTPLHYIIETCSGTPAAPDGICTGGTATQGMAWYSKAGLLFQYTFPASLISWNTALIYYFGDIHAVRTANTGVIYLGGASGNNYIYYDGSLMQTPNPLTVNPGGAVPAWAKYSLVAIANGVNGCANANGCWQVNGVLGANKTAGFTQDVVLFALPPNGQVTDWRMKTTSACTGTATALSGLGVTGNNVLFRPQTYNIAVAPGNTNLSTGPTAGAGTDTAAGTNVVASLITTVQNVDQLVAGCQVDYSVLWAVLP